MPDNTITTPVSKAPWSVHSTGSHLGLKDADGKFVFRKVVSSVTHEQFHQLNANLKHIAAAINAYPEIDGRIEAEAKSFALWLENYSYAARELKSINDLWQEYRQALGGSHER